MSISRRKSLFRPKFDVLEDRLAPAVGPTWQGDVDISWSTPGNWDGNQVPVDGSIVIFPDNPASKVSVNNITGLDLASIQINDDGYSIGGNAITLSQDLTANMSGSAQSNFNLNITLQAIKQKFLNLNAGTNLSLGGTISLNKFRPTLGGDGVVIVSGVISGAPGITKTGPGVLRLQAANTYTGTTSIKVGTLEALHANALGATGAGTTVDAGASLAVGAGLTLGAEPITLTGELRIAGGTSNPESTQVTGPIVLSGAAEIEVPPSDTLTLTGVLSSTGGFDKANSGTLVLAGNNSYSGTTTVLNGRLECGADGAMSPLSPLVVNGSGVFDLKNFAAIVLSLSGGGTVTNSGADPLSLSLQVPDGDSAQFDGVISGKVNLNMGGAGTQILTGANTYTGTTTISAGTLALGVGTGVPAASPLVIEDAGTFDLNGFVHTRNFLGGAGTVTNTSATASTLTVAPGSGESLQFDGELTGNFQLHLNGANISSRLDLGGVNPNTYTGITRLFRGSLILEKPAGVTAVPNSSGPAAGLDLIIGDGPGAAEEARVLLAAADQIADGGSLLVSRDGVFDTASFNETLDKLILDGGIVFAGDGGGRLLQVNQLNVGSDGGTLEFRLSGTTPDVSHDQIRSSNLVNVTNLTLDLTVSFEPALGDSFTIIDKTSAGAVTGTFVGLPEGATFVEDGLRFQISYIGGNGNDVVVTRIFGPDIIVAAPERLAVPQVRVFDAASGLSAYAIDAFPAAFDGGVRIAVADVNNDDFPDIIAGPGTQDETLGVSGIRVFNGLDGTPLAGTLGTGFNPFGAAYIRGFFVAAGDFNADGHADIVAGRNNAFTTIKVVSGVDGTTELASIENLFPNSGTYRKGVRLAVADVNGDGTPDIIATCGRRIEALVRVVDGTTFQPLAGPLGAGFNPFVDLPAIVQPLFVAAGDIDGDGKAELIVSVKNIFNTIRVFDQAAVKIREFAGHPDAGYTGGMRVGVTDVNGDNRAEILIGTGAVLGLKPAVRCLDAATLAEIDAFFASDVENLGVFVAGSV